MISSSLYALYRYALYREEKQSFYNQLKTVDYSGMIKI